MAGHSKWANIKFKKASTDKKRGKAFTKAVKEVTVAARLGGADIDSNPRLRTAVYKAYAVNMTKDAVERAIKKGIGDNDGKNLEEIRYEAYAANGVALIIDCLSDNRNRTVSEVRYVLSRKGGNMASSGAVEYMFERLGVLVITAVSNEDELFELALNHGAEDIEQSSPGEYVISCSPSSYQDLFAVLQDKYTITHSEVAFRANDEVKLDPDATAKVMSLIEALEDLDDVQDVYTNLSLVEDE